jgi:SPP1 family predicted phage head-tail adaptor
LRERESATVAHACQYGGGVSGRIHGGLDSIVNSLHAFVRTNDVRRQQPFKECPMWRTIIQSNNPVLQVGKMRQRISLLTPSNVQDELGGTTLSGWTVFAEVWASIEAVNGNEKFAAGEYVSTSTHRIVIRYQDGITSNFQVLFGVRKFQITNVSNPTGRTHMLVLDCVEINDSAQQGI